MTEHVLPWRHVGRPGLCAPLLLGIALAFPAFAADELPPVEHVHLTPAHLEQAIAPKAARPGLHILQLDPAAAPTADTLARAGIEVIAYLPESAWIVRLRAGAAAKLAALPRVLRLLPYTPDLKVATGTGPGELFVVGAPGDEAPLAKRLAAVPGVQVLHVNQRFGVTYARVRAADAAAIAELATLDDVVWVESELRQEFHNTQSVGVIQANGDSGGAPPTNTPVWNRDLIGTGQIVAVADSGLDRNEEWFRFYDDGTGVLEATTDAESPPPGRAGQTFPERKVVAYWVQPGASAYDGSEICRDGGFPSVYHGTHVTGTVAGDSDATASPTEPNHDAGDGMAPNAQILFQDIGNDSNGCLSIVDFADTLTQAFLGGARIHNNSWGAVPRNDDDSFRPGYYTNDFLGDLATHGLNDLLVVTSAGNSGDEFAPSRSIGPPGNGKNILTVGATEHGNNPAISEFSSRGPAHDDRYKPDVVAPGVDVESALGDNNDVLPPPIFGGDQITRKSGTSMASPTVAGGAALARQYYSDGFYPSGRRTAADAMTPSGALLKATLLNGTRRYANTPANDTGWGRLWLDQALHFSGENRRLRAWDVAPSHGLTTGQTHEYTIDVGPNQEFRATLVWFDPPAFSGSGRALVNDLDLEIIAPDGTYRGNRFSGGESTTGGGHDRLNPVEQVIIDSPTGGVYTLRVKAHAVPGNSVAGSTRQGYGLVATGQSCSSVPGAPDFDVSGGSAIAVSGQGPLEVYRVEGSCDAPASEFRFIGAGTDGFTDVQVDNGQSYAYRVRATNSCGASAYSACKTATAGLSAPTLDVSGPWFSDGQSGHGWLIEQLPPAGAQGRKGGSDRITAYWYVYRDGAPAWLIAQGDLVGATATLDALITSGADFPPAFDADDVDLDAWGTLSFTFDGDDAGTASWESFYEGFGSGELPIRRIAPLATDPAACVAGSYLNPDQAGHGFVAEVFAQNGRLEVLVAWYVYIDGEQLWLLGQAPLVDRAAEIPLQAFSGPAFPPAFDSGDLVIEDWGTLTIEFDPPNGASVSWDAVLEGFEDGSLALSRLSTLTGRACD